MQILYLIRILCCLNKPLWSLFSKTKKIFSISLQKELIHYLNRNCDLISRIRVCSIQIATEEGVFRISLNFDKFNPCPLGAYAPLDFSNTTLIAFNLGIISASFPYFLTLQLSRETIRSIFFIWTEFITYSRVLEGSTAVNVRHYSVSGSTWTETIASC